MEFVLAKEADDVLKAALTKNIFVKKKDAVKEIPPSIEGQMYA